MKYLLTVMQEADEFYKAIPNQKMKTVKNIQRQAFAGMLWSKQYFNFDIPQWLNGDKGQPAPPEQRKRTAAIMNGLHLNNEDIISMPDKWEYPWYAAWDLAFHVFRLPMMDAAVCQGPACCLLLREWYMHPNGQMPAYEWTFSDVNPPVHAWAAWRYITLIKAQNGRR